MHKIQWYKYLFCNLLYKKVLIFFTQLSRFLVNVRLPGIGKFQILVLAMEVALVKDYQFAQNIISLASNLYWGQRLQCKIQSHRSKIRPKTKWPLSNLKFQNVIRIWYFNQNKLIWDFRGHIGLKLPQNSKFK